MSGPDAERRVGAGGVTHVVPGDYVRHRGGGSRVHPEQGASPDRIGEDE